jgi:hypothetical protein
MLDGRRFNASICVMVATKKALLFKMPTTNVKVMLGADSLRKKNTTELKSATVAINENVVQAVLQFLSAETL